MKLDRFLKITPLLSLVVVFLFILVVWLVDSNIIANYVGAISSVFSAIGVLLAYLTVRDTIDERIEKSKPELIVTFPLRANGDIDFVIQNAGPNIAKNIKIEFDPVPIDFLDQKLSEWELLKEPFDLPGNTQEQNFFHSAPQLLGTPGKDIPKICTVTVKCETATGIECAPRHFRFNFERHRRHIVPESENDHLNVIAQELGRLRQATEKISQRDITIIEHHSEFIERRRRESEAMKERMEALRQQQEAEGVSPPVVGFNPPPQVPPPAPDPP